MKMLDSKQILSQLQEGGSVANALPSYEPRKSQLDLLSLIISAFNEDALLMGATIARRLRRVDDQIQHAPAPNKSHTMNKMRLALASRLRRGHSEVFSSFHNSYKSRSIFQAK